MVRIVLVGAGSVEFTRNLLGDLLSYPDILGVGVLRCALVSLPPMVVLFLIAQKYFVRGIALSGLKG